MPIPRRSIELTQVTEWDDGTVRPFEDCLAAEEPLEIRIGAKPIVVTMRTPGHDKELAAGFLWTEGIIDSPRCIVAIKEADGRLIWTAHLLRPITCSGISMQRRAVAFAAKRRSMRFACAACILPIPVSR